jgi:hypothetical protein
VTHRKCDVCGASAGIWGLWHRQDCESPQGQDQRRMYEAAIKEGEGRRQREAEEADDRIYEAYERAKARRLK